MTRARILLADGHQMQLDALATLLGRSSTSAVWCGWQPTLKDDGESSARYRGSGNFSANLDGIDYAAKIIRKELSSVKIVFLTMYADLPLVEKAFRSGASGYVLKTGRVEEL